MKSFIAALATLVAAPVLLFANGALAAEIKVMASIAVKEAYSEVVPHFEKSSGHKVVTVWAGTADMMKRIGGGEVVDMVILAAASVDELTRQGRLVEGSKTAVAKSGVGVAVRTGTRKLDLTSGETLKKGLLAAKSIAYSSGPSGVYLANLFQQWGIADEIKSRVMVIPPGQPVGELIARGGADVGFQQVSELLPIKGIDYLGPLPPDIQLVTVFYAGLHSQAPAPDAAKALVKSLTSPEAASAFKKSGMEPG